jgi:hypothetical protein
MKGIDGLETEVLGDSCGRTDAVIQAEVGATNGRSEGEGKVQGGIVKWGRANSKKETGSGESLAPSRAS